MYVCMYVCMYVYVCVCLYNYSFIYLFRKEFTAPIETYSFIAFCTVTLRVLHGAIL